MGIMSRISLNPDLLYDVIQECVERNHSSRFTTKIILCGKENLKVVRKFLKKADVVKFSEHERIGDIISSSSNPNTDIERVAHIHVS